MHSAPTSSASGATRLPPSRSAGCTVRSIASAALTVSLSILGAAAGCADPQASLDDFTERDCASKDQPYDESGCARLISSGGCEPPAPGEADGRYLFAIAASLSPTKPVLFSAQITTTAATNGIDVAMVLEGISAEDRQTPLGDPQTFPTFFVDADGQFATDETEFSLPGGANTVTPGNEAVVSISLTGRFCKQDLSCGALDGVTIMPAGVPLEGSAFTILPAPEGEPFPDPVVDCEGTPAAPL